MEEDISRRTLLRSGSAGLAAVSSAGLAGCAGSLPFLGDEEDGSSGPPVGNWLAAPAVTDLLDTEALTERYTDGTVDSSEEIDRQFNAVVPDSVFEHEEELVVYWPLERGAAHRSRAGVAATDLDWELSQTVSWEFEVSHTRQTWDGTTTQTDTMESSVEYAFLAGSFDPASIKENLQDWVDDEYAEDDELSSEGDHEGYELYAIENWAFGVSEGSIVQANGGSYLDAVSAVEAAIDANASASGLWSETDDGGAMLGEFSAKHMSSGSVHEPRTVETELERQYGDPDNIPDQQRQEIEDRIEDQFDDWERGLTGTATTYEFDGDTSEFTEVFLYDSESDANAEALTDHVDSNRDVSDRWATLEDSSIDGSGRTLVLSGTVRTRSLL